MIRVELSMLVFIYLFVFLAALFSLWIAYEWKRVRREKEALRYRVRCTICATIFEDRTNVVLPRCPRCGSLNERFEIGGL
jgi:DNA-directed RNA polymerase subunit RPC12/RpoP